MSTQSEECFGFIEEIKSEYKYGWVQVPENYNNPNSELISVFWYTKIKQGQKPVVFFYGGPLWDDRYHYKVFSALEDKFNLGFIYMDQRGTGCSTKPPSIIDYETSLKATQYSSENMVHDAEIIRKKLLGDLQPWAVFGQSYGGYVVDRYVHMFPKSITEAYNFAGGTTENFTEFFYERLKSNLRVSKIYFDANPDKWEKLKAFRALFHDLVCWEIRPGQNQCGLELYNQIAEYYLGYVDYWPDFSDILDEPVGCEWCVFSSQGILNPDFMNSYVLDNFWSIDFFFNEEKYIRSKALWRQEIVTADASGSLELDCLNALARLESENIGEEQMPYNHCFKVIRAHTPHVKKILYEFVALTPAEKPMKIQDLVSSLSQQSQLKYFAYSAEFDPIGSNDQTFQAIRHLPNVTYRHFMEVEHSGYLEEAQVWKDLSGLNIPFYDSTISYESKAKSNFTIEARAASNSVGIHGLSLNEKAIDLGFADQDFSEDEKKEINGKIAFISRGRITFVEKIERAFKAGAIAVVIGNNNPFLQKPFVIEIDDSIEIPVMMVSTKDFVLLRNQLNEDRKSYFHLIVNGF